MQQNAFTRLFVSPSSERGKHTRPRPRPNRKRLRSATTPTPATTPQGSRFVECPLCWKSFHSSLAQSHVDRCPGVQAEARTRPSFSSETGKTRHEPTARNRADSSATGSNGDIDRASEEYPASLGGSMREWEGCEVMVSRPMRIKDSGLPQAGEGARGFHQGKRQKNNKEKHCVASSTPGNVNIDNTCCHSGSVGTSLEHSTKNDGAATTLHIAQSITTSDNPTPPAPVKKNAFSKMIAASALADFREEMYLWAHNDGTLSWGWGPAGDPCPAPPERCSYADLSGRKQKQQRQQHQQHRRWSCQVATKGPDGYKAGTCELWTNLPSAPVAMGQCEIAAAGRMFANGPLAAAFADGNAGLRAARPSESLSRLPVPVLKSMLQKNIRRRNAEAASRCALELALKSWSDAIRRVLVIVVEDSLLHPAAPLLSWLMAATSKGYRPPIRLVDAFLRVVHETAACPVRDTVDSCLVLDPIAGRPVSLAADGSPVPHPRDLIPPNKGRNRRESDQPGESSVAEQPDVVKVPSPGGRVCDDDTRAEGFQRKHCCGAEAGDNLASVGKAAGGLIACCRRALLLRISYGGLACDQALLKGSCLGWGERCGHLPAFSKGSTQVNQRSSAPPAPLSRPASCGAVSPFGYIHESVLSALVRDPWMEFVLLAHDGGGMPAALRSTLLAHVTGGGEEATFSRGEPGKWKRGEAPSTEERTATTGHQTRPKSGTEAAVTSSRSAKSSGIGPVLRETDAALSGVDFHCSKVLDDVLRPAAVAERVETAIRAAEAAGKDPRAGIPLAAKTSNLSVEPPREPVMQAAKRAMWACSSGVNGRELRLTFTRGAGEGGPASETLVSALSPCSAGDEASETDVRSWEVISMDVSRWARKFVRGRLAPGATRSPE